MAPVSSVVAGSAPRPPADSIGVLGWLRTRLFSSVLNSILTILCIGLLVWIVPPLIDWMILDAVWSAAPPEVCRAAEGACWALLHEKARLILFGRYPYVEQWRPLLAMTVLIVAIALSCNRNFWRPWLAGVWAGTLALFGLLMWGGVLGMTYVENTLWGGLPLTMILSVFGMVGSFPLAVALALGRRSRMPIIHALSVGYIELIRGVPLISVLFMASFMFPLFLPSGVKVDELLRAQVAIILFTAAYLAEVIRGGLQSIPRGQDESAKSLGLNYWQTTTMIVLPQALRAVIPPIVNTFISLFKDTSLVAIVSLFDLLGSLRLALADPLWRNYFIEGYVFVALIYFFFCFFMSKYSQYLESQLQTGHRP
ncbi:MAG: amino acid ABC transporter permease [Rhodospirillales bacterium]|nr:amino acid ABC transporter permease [Rhodospirillales bacterium]